MTARIRTPGGTESDSNVDVVGEASTDAVVKASQGAKVTFVMIRSGKAYHMCSRRRVIMGEGGWVIVRWGSLPFWAPGHRLFMVLSHELKGEGDHGGVGS